MNCETHRGSAAASEMTRRPIPKQTNRVTQTRKESAPRCASVLVQRLQEPCSLPAQSPYRMITVWPSMTVNATDTSRMRHDCRVDRLPTKVPRLCVTKSERVIDLVPAFATAETHDQGEFYQGQTHKAFLINLVCQTFKPNRSEGFHALARPFRTLPSTDASMSSRDSLKRYRYVLRAVL